VILRGNFAPSFGLKRRRFPLPRASSIRRRYSNASSGGARAGAANFNVDGARRDASGAFRRRFCVFFVAFFRGRLLFAAFAGIIVRDARDGVETFAGSTFLTGKSPKPSFRGFAFVWAIPETLREVDLRRTRRRE